MKRPERDAPGDSSGPEEGWDRDGRTAAHLLTTLREEDPVPPLDLPHRIGRRVRDRITFHDLVEVTTRAFLRGALIPIAERVAQAFSRWGRGDVPPPDAEG